MSAPVTITVAQATDENKRLLSLIVGEEFDRSAFQDVVQIGCRTDPESLMSVGPPFSVRTTWVKHDPSPEFVAAALRRVDFLQAEGFQRTPWTRPQPEPPNTRAYKDNRGYGITASDKVRPSGRRCSRSTSTRRARIRRRPQLGGGMVNRLVATLVVGAVLVSGCGDAAKKPKSAPIHIDWKGELQSDIQEQRRALEDYDIDAGAALMCDKYRDTYRQKLESQLPTMASIATPEQAADPAYVAALPDLIKQRYPNTYTEERQGVADAAAHQDPAAFHVAAIKLMGRIFNVKDQKVANIDIAGGDHPSTATADVTTTTTLNDQPPQTQTVHKSFVLQGVEWLDCTDPGQ